MAQTWIVTASAQIGRLLELAGDLHQAVTVVAVGPAAPRPAGVDRVLVVAADEGQPIEALAPVVASALAAGPGDVVLAPDRREERVLAGAVAARLGAPVVWGATRTGPGRVERARYGGIVLEQVRTDGPLVVVADGGPAVEDAGTPAETFTGTAHRVVVTGSSASKVHASDLGSASRIVSAGRGFKAEADLDLARELAGALGAELACTRPLAEGLDWLPRDRYVGVSGQQVTPDLYVAVGVSGQLQHMSGVSGARTIVAINSDADAPVFAYADYGIVGDLYQVVPALTAALG